MKKIIHLLLITVIVSCYQEDEMQDTIKIKEIEQKKAISISKKIIKDEVNGQLKLVDYKNVTDIDLAIMLDLEEFKEAHPNWSTYKAQNAFNEYVSIFKDAVKEINSVQGCGVKFRVKIVSKNSIPYWNLVVKFIANESAVIGEASTPYFGQVGNRINIFIKKNETYPLSNKIRRLKLSTMIHEMMHTIGVGHIDNKYAQPGPDGLITTNESIMFSWSLDTEQIIHLTMYDKSILRYLYPNSTYYYNLDKIWEENAEKNFNYHSRGKVPVVKISNNGIATEIHRSHRGYGIWYSINHNGHKLKHSYTQKLDYGLSPTIAIADFNSSLSYVFQAHRSQNNGRIYFRIGEYRRGNKKVGWMSKRKFNSCYANLMSSSINRYGTVILAYTAYKSRRLIVLVGQASSSKVNWISKRVLVNQSVKDVSCAINNKGEIAIAYQLDNAQKSSLSFISGKINYNRGQFSERDILFQNRKNYFLQKDFEVHSFSLNLTDLDMHLCLGINRGSLYYTIYDKQDIRSRSLYVSFGQLIPIYSDTFDYINRVSEGYYPTIGVSPDGKRTIMAIQQNNQIWLRNVSKNYVPGT